MLEDSPRTAGFVVRQGILRAPPRAAQYALAYYEASGPRRFFQRVVEARDSGRSLESILPRRSFEFGRCGRPASSPRPGEVHNRVSFFV